MRDNLKANVLNKGFWIFRILSPHNNGVILHENMSVNEIRFKWFKWILWLNNLSRYVVHKSSEI